MATKIRRYIDPTTGDYVREGGGFKGDAGFTSKAVIAMRTRRGSCAVMPSFGSRAHMVQHVDEKGAKLLEYYHTEAVAHLSADVEDLKVTVTIPEGTQGVMLTEVSGSGDAQKLHAQYSVKV